MIKNARIVTQEANPNDYHAPQEAKRGTLEYVMSNSAMANFATCPARYIAGYEAPDSDAKRWGNLLDCAVLTPELFSQRYAVQPLEYEAVGMQCPQCESITDSQKCAKCKRDRVQVRLNKEWNNNADVCQQWVKAQGRRIIIKADELSAVEAAKKRLMDDDTIARFLDASNKQVWLAAEWHDPDTGIVVPLRGLLDAQPKTESEFSDCLGDLKSSRNAAMIPWQRWCYTAGYHRQAALYLDLWKAATGEDRTTFCFIVQENYEPWQYSRKLLGQDGSNGPGFVMLGREEYRATLKAYCQCIKTGFWPGYDDHDEAVQGWTVVRPEPWMAERAMFGPKFQMPTEEPPPDPAQDPEWDGRH